MQKARRHAAIIYYSIGLFDICGVTGAGFQDRNMLSFGCGKNGEMVAEKENMS